MVLAFSESPEFVALSYGAVQYIAVHQAILGTAPSAATVAGAVPVADWLALIRSLYASPAYGGVDVPGIPRATATAPAPTPPVFDGGDGGPPPPASPVPEGRTKRLRGPGDCPVEPGRPA